MAAFTPGNIVVYRVGTGTGALSSASTAVFLDEYTPGGVLVQSVAVPTAANGTNNPLTASGTASSEGFLTRSADGQSLEITGYDTTTGTGSVAGTASSTVPRDVGIVSAAGAVDTSTVLTGFSSTNNIRSTAEDGTKLYVAGATGIAVTTPDSTTAPTTLSALNTRQIEIVNGQVFASTGSANTTLGTTPGIVMVGTGEPTTGTPTLTQLAGISTPSPYGFFAVNLNPATTGSLPDTIYVADDSTSANGGGIIKYSLGANNTYAKNGTVDMGGVTRGLTGIVNPDGSVTLYTTDMTGTRVESVVDPNASGPGSALTATPTLVATAPANEAFRGVALAPQAAAAPCYASGTRIRTWRGDVAVEALAVGDLAVTASGAMRPIRWIGHRLTDCLHHPRPLEVMPIRITAHAFGLGRPARDLVVSPGHAICVDAIGEVLIPAGALVNGTTILQESVDAVTYWHVELESHDVLLAENLPAESYLDMGNRVFFEENGVVVLHGSPDAVVPTHADFCRPFHGDGAMVEAVRARLDARAGRLGLRLERPVRLAG